VSDLDHEALLTAQREQAIRDVIDSSRDDVPPPEGKARLFAKLALEPASRASHRPALWRVREGASVYLVGLALVVGGSMALLSSQAEGPRVTSSRVNAAAPADPEAPASDESPAGDQTRDQAPPNAEPIVPPAPAAPAVSPGAVDVPERGSMEASPSEPSTVAPAPRPTDRPHTNGVPTPSAAPSSTALLVADAARSNAPAQSASTLGREVARMTAARSALAAGDAARTLEILDSYESEFPSGAFSVEVSVLRVEALARAGRMDEARRLGERFLQQYPHGLFARRVTSTLGAANNPEPAAEP
jgi:hypothetical protein